MWRLDRWLALIVGTEFLPVYMPLTTDRAVGKPNGTFDCNISVMFLLSIDMEKTSNFCDC